MSVDVDRSRLEAANAAAYATGYHAAGIGLVIGRTIP